MHSGPSGLPAVVVVGAGAAGIGAGLALARSRVPYIILEASSRLGGRAYTDCDSLGSLFDHGCHWFHSADRNPLRVLADRLGHAYAGRIVRGVRPLCIDGQWLDQAERESINAMIFGMFDEIEAAAGQGRDVAASDVIDFSGRFGPLRRHWIELLECRAPEEVSIVDAGRYFDTRVNFAVKDGYGRLFEKLSRGLAVRFASPVSAIETRKDGVRVSGSFGEIDCAAVILTASLGVLAAGAIALRPAPDQAFAAALDDIRMGSYEKTVIAFDRPVLTFPPGTESSYCDIVDPADADDLPLNFEIHPFGRPLAISHLAGGSLDRGLAKDGPRGLIDLSIGKLVRAFGADIRRHIVGTLVTSWGRNPYVRGGYAIARPGRARSRDRLIAGDISDRVFLAGEACHPYWFATAHGAYLTGIDRAHRALAAIGHPAAPPDALWLPEFEAAAGG
jgi:monoamine oxidase